jgi:hypothetical protein
VFAKILCSSATNAITNSYGVYVEAPTNVGTITNKYGVYQVSPTDTNVFFGPISASAITASSGMYGTSSYSEFAISSSNTVSSSYSVSSSFAVTSSYSRNTTTAISSSYSTTAANLTPTSNFMGGLGTWGTQAIALSSSYTTGFTLSNIADGGQSLVRIYIGGYWVSDQKPASYYGEYMLQKIPGGVSPQPGMIIREVNCNFSNRRVMAQIVDPGPTASPTSITVQFMITGSTGGLSGSIFYEKIGDQTGFPP